MKSSVDSEQLIRLRAFCLSSGMTTLWQEELHSEVFKKMKAVTLQRVEKLLSFIILLLNLIPLEGIFVLFGPMQQGG